MSAYFLVALLVAGIVVVAVRYDDINATPDANSAAQMASNPVTAHSKEFHLKRASAVLMSVSLELASLKPLKLVWQQDKPRLPPLPWPAR